MLLIYMIILDGAADRPIWSLGERTPLECAKTPGMDKLASKSSLCMVSVIGKNIPPESDSGTMALLSYDPLLYYPGRGTLEGIGTGLLKGYRYSASFRINFASYDSKHQFLDRRTARGLNDEELQCLALELNEKIRIGRSEEQIKMNLTAFGHHRGILVLTSNQTKLSGNVSNTDPGFKKEGCFSLPIPNYRRQPLQCFPQDDTAEAERTAELVNQFTQEAAKILSDSSINQQRIKKGLLPANCILTRDGGTSPKELMPFYQKFNWELSIFGQLPAEQAIADLIQGKFYYTKAFELQMDSEYLQKIVSIFVNNPANVKYIHLKGPDEPAHDQKPYDKVKAIEKIDHYFMEEFLKYVTPEDFVIVTCDHTTPCELGIHSSDPVPFMVSGPGIRSDGLQRFTESQAAQGSCQIKQAIDILPFIRSKAIWQKG